MLIVEIRANETSGKSVRALHMVGLRLVFADEISSWFRKWFCKGHCFDQHSYLDKSPCIFHHILLGFLMTFLAFCDLMFCLVFQLSHDIPCILHHISLGFSTFTSHPLHFASHFAWFFNFHITSLAFYITFCLVFQLSHHIPCILHHISLGFSTFMQHFTTFDINNKISGWRIKGGFKVKWRMISCHPFYN
jgi:hypothetical protein